MTRRTVQTVIDRIVTETMGREGPTGDLVLVERAELVDAGGNRYATATTPRGIARAHCPRGVHTRWVAVRTGRRLRASEYSECVI